MPNRKWNIVPMPSDAAPVRTQTITIHWKDENDAPRVTPAIAIVKMDEDLVFEVKGNASGTIYLPAPAFRLANALTIAAGGQATGHSTSDRMALLPKGFMYTYTPEMVHKGKPAHTMAAVGNSPPAMVLDDPDGRDGPDDGPPVQNR